MTLASDLQTTAPGVYVVLYELDLTTKGGTVQRFTPMVNNTGLASAMTPVLFDGNAYTPIPIVAKGFEKSAKGQVARPTLQVGNVTNIWTQLLRDFGGLRGVPLRRIRTLSKFLDDGSEPDAGQVLPIEEYVVARKTQHNKFTVEFELRAAIDIEGIVIPKGNLLRGCTARYRIWNGSSFTYDTSDMACPYTDAAKFDVHDAPAAGGAQDICSKTIGGCKARFGENSPLPFMGEPGAARAR